MRLAAALLTAALLAASLAACGSSGSGSETTRGGSGPQRAGQPGSPAGASAQPCAGATGRVEGLRVTAASCSEGQGVVRAWQHAGGCQPGAGASRAGCSVGSYRCSAVRPHRLLHRSAWLTHSAPPGAAVGRVKEERQPEQRRIFGDDQCDRDRGEEDGGDE